MSEKKFIKVRAHDYQPMTWKDAVIEARHCVQNLVDSESGYWICEIKSLVEMPPDAAIVSDFISE